ncbi:sodium-dependent multivitamin transporter-like [Pecten maximus]|uniref:sodium-dependent multivitamin transporter-like n=1 Tax=Pecten maximus TaxID=6579 RepID=UPI0014581478|nr:sodium-dependent multivitamin transporter-like [Pecten maximus]
MMTDSEVQGFVALDYVVFVSILLISIGIGVYQACCKPKQDTIKQYILADRKLNILPVALSMTVSFQSSIMLLGNPAEMYVYGVPFMWQAIGLVLSNLFAMCSIIPLIHPLKITSVYEGGIKAVVWSNVFQFLVVFVGIFSIIIQCTIEVGSVQSVFDMAYDGMRLRLPFTSPNPTVRHSYWTLIIGSFISLTCQLPMLSSYSEGCTKILPYLVVLLFREMPGMAGVFVAAVLSASLSAITSLLSSLSAQTVVDIVQPLAKDISEAKATLIAKLCIPVYGVMGIGVSFLIAKVEGPLSEIIYSMLSSFGGASAGMFFFAAYCPWANSKGVITGGLTGMGLVMWIALGQSFSPTRTRAQTLPPVSTELCWSHNHSLFLGNITTLPSQDLTSTVSIGDLEHNEGIDVLYSISYFWLIPLCMLTTIVVGSLVSVLTGRPDPADVDVRYILPFFDHCCPCLPRAVRKRLYGGVRFQERTAWLRSLYLNHKDDEGATANTIVTSLQECNNIDTRSTEEQLEDNRIPNHTMEQQLWTKNSTLPTQEQIVDHLSTPVPDDAGNVYNGDQLSDENTDSTREQLNGKTNSTYL